MRTDHIGHGRGHVLALTAFALLAAVIFADAWSDPLHRSVAPGLDSMNTMWFLRWVPFALTHGDNPLLTTHMNFPHGANVMWNNGDSIPAVGFLTAPFQALLPLPAVFDLVATVAVALSGWTAYLAIRRHVESAPAAFLGGLIYGFGPYMSAQWHGHIGLNLAFVAPLMLILLEEILVHQCHRPLSLGAVLGVLAAFQLVLAEEILATEAVVITVLLGLMVVLRPRDVGAKAPFAVRSLLGALVVSLILAGPVLAEQFLGPQHLRGVLTPPNEYVTDLQNLVLPTASLFFHPLGIVGGDGWTGNGTEWNGYIGIPVVAVCAVAAMRLWHRVDMRLAVLVAVVATVFSLGPRVHIGGRVTAVPGLWHALRLPLLQNILPARLMLFVDLAVGWMVASLLDDLLRLPRRGRTVLAAGGVGAVVVLTLMPALPGPAETHDVPAYFTGPGVQALVPGSTALIFPLPEGRAFNQRYAYQPLLWQIAANFRFRVPVSTVIVPDAELRRAQDPDLGPLADAVVGIQDGSHAPPQLDRDRVLVDLRQRQFSAVILGPMPRRENVLEVISKPLGTGQEEGGVTVWYLDR